MDASHIVLGTAQFGLRYGVANTSGQIGIDEAASVLRCGRELGIGTLDTAVDYGESEARLGELGVGEWAVNTKLPAVPEECRDVFEWVATQVGQSLARLRIAHLNALLLHRPQQLLGAKGAEIYRALADLKSRGLVARIGVSVYGPDELEALCSRYRFDVVQAPVNVVDRSLVASGWLNRLVAAGVAVQARSVFLQGLLLMDSRPAYFSKWDDLWHRWRAWLDARTLTPLQACLGYIASLEGIDSVVVGVDSQSQLTQIAAALRSAAIEPPAQLASEDRALIHPSQWASTT